ncbi:hypothetical protein PanWU01x14_360880, partial [Parasponia andersonii]
IVQWLVRLYNLGQGRRDSETESRVMRLLTYGVEKISQVQPLSSPWSSSTSWALDLGDLGFEKFFRS